MFERYTERANRVIFFARNEAVQLGSTTIDSEHLLLGLLREDGDLASRFLRTSTEVIRKEVEDRTTIRQKVSNDDPLPMSNECKRILTYTAEEADHLLHPHIGTEHLLLAILREENCTAAEILQQHGLRLDAIREELARSSKSAEPRVTFRPHKLGCDPGPPKFDADTAKRIAEAAWIPRYGADTVAKQAPIRAELQFNGWIVTGSSSAEAPLYAFISQRDGRILAGGQWADHS